MKAENKTRQTCMTAVPSVPPLCVFYKKVQIKRMKKRMCRILCAYFLAAALAVGLFKTPAFAADDTVPPTVTGPTVAPTQAPAADEPPAEGVAPTPTPEGEAAAAETPTPTPAETPEADPTPVPSPEPTQAPTGEESSTSGEAPVPTPEEETATTETPTPAPVEAAEATPTPLPGPTATPTPTAVPEANQAAVPEAAAEESPQELGTAYAPEQIAPEPAAPSYAIAIPKTVDFGALTQPETDADSIAICHFSVTAELQSFADGQAVQLFVKDSAATDGGFYLVQENAENPFRLPYSIYTGDTLRSTGSYGGAAGYLVCEFTNSWLSQEVTLSLNQKALYGQNNAAIAGSYTGHLTFYSRMCSDTIG